MRPLKIIVLAVLVLTLLGGCEMFREGFGKTDFWTDRERAKALNGDE